MYIYERNIKGIINKVFDRKQFHKRPNIIQGKLYSIISFSDYFCKLDIM